MLVLCSLQPLQWQLKVVLSTLLNRQCSVFIGHLFRCRVVHDTSFPLKVVELEIHLTHISVRAISFVSSIAVSIVKLSDYSQVFEALAERFHSDD